MCQKIRKPDFANPQHRTHEGLQPGPGGLKNSSRTASSARPPGFYAPSRSPGLDYAVQTLGLWDHLQPTGRRLDSERSLVER